MSCYTQAIWLVTERSLNQIKEAFCKLKNFEHDAGESIKNIEFCLDDISKIVVEASNDAFPIQAKLSAIKKRGLEELKLKLNIPSLPPKMSTKSRPTNGSNSVINDFWAYILLTYIMLWVFGLSRLLV